MATLASLAPYDGAGLDWTAGMAEENVEEFGAAARGATAYHRFLRKVPAPAADRTAEQMVADLAGLLTPVDAAYMTGEFAAYFNHSGRRGREQDVVGWRDDGLALVHDWGFDPEAITAPVAVWHGREDAMVPFGHGEWLDAADPRQPSRTSSTTRGTSRCGSAATRSSAISPRGSPEPGQRPAASISRISALDSSVPGISVPRSEQPAVSMVNFSAIRPMTEATIM